MREESRLLPIRLAVSFNLGSRDRFSLRIAALAHDLGELVMNRDDIRRAGTLSDDERMISLVIRCW